MDAIGVIQRRLAHHQAAVEELEALLEVLGESPAVEADDAADDDEVPNELPPPRGWPAPLVAVERNGEHAPAAVKTVVAPVPASPSADKDPRMVKSCQKMAQAIKAGPIPTVAAIGEKLGINNPSGIRDRLERNPEWFARGSQGWHLTAEGVRVLLAHGG